MFVAASVCELVGQCENSTTHVIYAKPAKHVFIQAVRFVVSCIDDKVNQLSTENTSTVLSSEALTTVLPSLVGASVCVG
jgi:hypothetical protein